jgi:hypothetical protein
MMMAVWGLLENRDLKSLKAPRTALVNTGNIAAVLTFIIARAVHWPETIVMLVAAAVGGYGGAQIGRRAPPKVVSCWNVVSDGLYHPSVLCSGIHATTAVVIPAASPLSQVSEVTQQSL